MPPNRSNKFLSFWAIVGVLLLGASTASQANTSAPTKLGNNTVTWSGTQALADFTVFRPTDLQGLLPAIKEPLDAKFCSPKKAAVRVVYGASELKKDGRPMLVILQDDAKATCWNPDVKEQKVSSRPDILETKAVLRSGPLEKSKKNPFKQVQLSLSLPGTDKYQNKTTRIHLTGFNGVTQEQLIEIAKSLKPV